MRYPIALPLLTALTAALHCRSNPEGKGSAETAAATPESSAAPVAPPASAAAAPAPSSTALPAPPDVAAPPADATKTPSGLATKVLAKGKGAQHPKPEDRVRVHYTGWTKNGKMFDSSVARGEATTFGVSQVIRGWTEGLQLMVEGEKRRLWIPADLAYGDRPRRPGAPAGDLVFDVELIELLAAPVAPENVSKPPANAKKTKTGLAYTVLKEGTGKQPTATDTVVVHYTGWTTDGKMFDSSVTRGQPASFRLSNVIPGWTEGVQLMKVGGKTRFWIPGKLAYGDKPTRPGAPAGTLVFDIELVDVR